MTEAPTIDIGIGESDREAIAEGLSRLLADSYTLYLKTHNYHWNVVGPMFNTLHLMFETQYSELALAVDEIAERIRALGMPAPGSYREFAALSSVTEDEGRARRHRDDPPAGRGAGDGGPHCPLDLPGRREGQRRTHCRPLDPAHAGPREDGLDAAQHARIGRLVSESSLTKVDPVDLETEGTVDPVRL